MIVVTFTWRGPATTLRLEPEGEQIAIPDGAVVAFTCEKSEPFTIDRPGETDELVIWRNARLVTVSVTG